MNSFFKNILKRAGIYHPLQSFYRAAVFSVKNKRYRKQYEKYKGFGYTCNVCGAMYQKFVPDNPGKADKKAIDNNHVIAGYGENIFCPNCMSTARERLVIAYLNDEIDLENKKVLHLSPEKNIYEFLKKKAIVTTADLTPGFYKPIDEAVQQQDATGLSFENNCFDLVIANHILEHIPGDRQAMGEIFRVMKPAARAILQVPYSETLLHTKEDPLINDPGKQSLLFGQKDHVRIYSLSDYVKRLREAGFSVEILAGRELDKYSKFAVQPNEKLLKISK